MANSSSSSSSPAGSSLGSPKDRYVDFYFSEFARYTEVVRKESDQETLDRAIAALLSICPDKNKREGLWSDYTKEKADKGVTTASVTLAGDFMSHMSELLEFTEKSYAAVF